MNRAGFERFKREVQIGDYVEFEYDTPFGRREPRGYVSGIGRFIVNISTNAAEGRRADDGLLYLWIKNYLIASPPK